MIAIASKKIAIIGAGISGLTAAYFLKKKGADVTLFEKEADAGGWIKTACHEGTLFEWGPRSIRMKDGAATLQLIHELGLSDELIFAAEDAKKRYLLQKGKLVPLPLSLKEFLRSSLTQGLIPLFFKELFRAKSRVQDESVYDFFSRRFSPAIADQFLDPLMKGIFAGNAKVLSMKSCFPEIWQTEQEFGSIIFGALRKKASSQKGIFTLKNGLGSLVKALKIQLKNECRFQTNVQDLKTLFSAGFDQVISTLPANQLAKILPESKLKHLLSKIPFVSCGVVHLGFEQDCNPFTGFGYLVPSSENEKILGMVFDSSVFPNQNTGKIKTRLSVMIQADKASLKDIALKGVREHLGILMVPEIVESAWMSSCIPQYIVGFSDLLKEIESATKEEFPYLTVLGTSFYGISVNQAISSVYKNLQNYQY